MESTRCLVVRHACRGAFSSPQVVVAPSQLQQWHDRVAMMGHTPALTRNSYRRDVRFLDRAHAMHSTAHHAHKHSH